MSGSTGTRPTPTPAPTPAPSAMDKRGCLEAAQSALIAATVTAMCIMMFVLGAKCCNPCCDKEDKEQDKIEIVHDTIYLPVKPAPVKKKTAKPAKPAPVVRDTIIVRDTVRVAPQIAKPDTVIVRDTVRVAPKPVKADTVVVRDTVRVPVQAPVATTPEQKPVQQSVPQYNGGSARATYVVRIRSVKTR